MRVLILGASGLIGRHLALALVAQNHRVTGLCRHPDQTLMQMDWVAADLLTMAENDLRSLCCQHDCVVMCVGIFDENPEQTFLAIHQKVAQKVFSVCEQTKCRLLHFSALGANHLASNEYARSKGWADDNLLKRDLDAQILRPSLVFAERGRSTQFFSRLTLSPLLVMPKTDALVQPLHIDDLVTQVCGLITRVEAVPAEKIIELVGPQQLSFADYLNVLREQIVGSKAITFSVPTAIFTALLAVKPAAIFRLFTAQSLDLMQHNNIAGQSGNACTIVGDKTPSQFVSAAMATGLRHHFWQLVARALLSLIWLFTTLVSSINFEQSQQLIAALPLSPMAQRVAIYAGISLDLVLGLLTLLWPKRVLWQFQMAVVFFYTLLISMFDPGWWLHPYGALSKNLAVLFVLAQLLRTEPKNTDSIRA